MTADEKMKIVEKLEIMREILGHLLWSCLYAAGCLIAIGIGTGAALGIAVAVIKWFVG